jgi:hypothetical protein
MKRYLTLLAVIILLLVACSGIPVPNQDTPATANPTTTPAAQSIQTSTSTPVGTWEMVIKGMIYDQSKGKPISGASISYIVVHSYFPEIQEGRLNKTISNEHGEFSLPMIVHDTDNIKILMEAHAFISFEERLDLFGSRSLNIGLTPLATATVSSP